MSTTLIPENTVERCAYCPADAVWAVYATYSVAQVPEELTGPSQFRAVTHYPLPMGHACSDHLYAVLVDDLEGTIGISPSTAQWVIKPLGTEYKRL